MTQLEGYWYKILPM